MGESDLEDALLDKLQSFLLELGHGICFEARQKRLLIGESYNFVDLVFYHRVLKCHLLIELKVGAFTHEHIGQLNTYAVSGPKGAPKLTHPKGEASEFLRNALGLDRKLCFSRVF